MNEGHDGRTEKGGCRIYLQLNVPERFLENAPVEVTIRPAESTGLNELLRFEAVESGRIIDVPESWLGDEGNLRVSIDRVEYDVELRRTDDARVQPDPIVSPGDADSAHLDTGDYPTLESTQPSQRPPRSAPIIIGPTPAEVADARSAFAASPPNEPGTNLFASSQTYIFIDTSDRNALSADPPKRVRGTMYEYAIATQPLGFALGHWLGTVSIEPGATVATATTSLTDDSGVAHQQSKNSQEGYSVSSSQLDQAQRVDSASQSSRAAETSLGLKTELEIAEPVANLLKLVTPKVQIGLSAGQSNAWAKSTAGVSQVLTRDFERSGRLRFASDALHGTQLMQQTGQEHRISAARNHDISRVRNIARFRINEQFITRTSKTGENDIVLVPVKDAKDAFDTDEDLIKNLVAIDTALLDPRLRPLITSLADITGDSLDNLVDKFVNGPVNVTFDITNRGDKLNFVLRGDTADGIRFWTASANATKGTGQSVTIDTDKGFVPLSLEISAVGHHILKRMLNSVKIENLAIAHVLSPQPRFALKSGDTRSFDIKPKGTAQNFASSYMARKLRLSRLRDHVNSHTAYYRLAIELLDNENTRWNRLQQGSPDLRPVDASPLGTIGNHVAYALLAPDLDTGSGDEDPRDSTDGLASIPTEATYDIAMPGDLPLATVDKAKLTAGSTYVNLPTSQSGGIEWPTLQHRPIPTDLANLLGDVAARLSEVTPGELKNPGSAVSPNLEQPTPPDPAELPNTDDDSNETGGTGEAEET